jgi:hypothetical protein
MRKLVLQLSGMLIFLSACSDNSPVKSSETLVARIGDKDISVNEFIRRAEYAVRPPYCRSDNYIHRKIVLNSLIAEKLMALEAGEQNELMENREVRLYLQGRREQAMRQWMYNAEMYDKVAIDSTEMKKTYRVAGRQYKISYFNVGTVDSREQVYTSLKKKETDFDRLYASLGGKGVPPTREIGFEDPENDAVIKALFSGKHEKGDIVGPVLIAKDDILVMRIDGWTDKIAMTDVQINDRWQTVHDKLTELEANALFDTYVRKLMRGKTVEFNRAIFEKLVNIVAPQYYQSEDEKKEAFNKRFWNKDRNEMILDDLSNQMNAIMDEPLLVHDGETWTVRTLEDAILSHPLVFRKRKMPKNEFAEQFKLAIVDLIRDQHITRDAYEKGYDKVPEVRRNYAMWKDNLLALYEKEQVLKNLNTAGKNETQIISEDLTPYIMDLTQKYRDEIAINTDAFENIKLTAIDMFVIQRDVPYPVMVPSFPMLTVHDKLDYGKRMNTEGQIADKNSGLQENRGKEDR